MTRSMQIIALALLTLGVSLAPALASDGIPQPWQLNFQEAATPVMERLTSLHNGLLILITVITLFVMVLLAYVCIRFSAKNNPTPSKNSHNTVIEVVWTVVPILILIGIAIPSVDLHYYINEVEEPDMTLKVVGYQWYWNYEYPEHGIQFDSNMKKDADLQPGDLRLLAVDNIVVVPVNKTVRVQMTAGDVIHAWAIPAFGVKQDAVPGKLNETWFRATRTGTFYGQCSELCGKSHGFMPIRVDVVSQEEFDAWVATAKEKFSVGLPPAGQYAALAAQE